MPRKVLAFASWRLRALFGDPNSSSADWKVMGLLVGVTMAGLLSAVFLLSVLLGCRLFNDAIIVSLTLLVVAAILFGYPSKEHLQALLNHHQPEFNQYSSAVGWIGTIVVLLVMVSMLAVLGQLAMVVRRLPESMCFG